MCLASASASDSPREASSLSASSSSSSPTSSTPTSTSPSVSLSLSSSPSATATTTTSTPADDRSATTTATPSPTHDKRVDLRTQFSQFAAGALAGLVNTLVLSPLDVVKTRLQVQGSASPTTAAVRGATAAAVSASASPASAASATAGVKTLRYAGTLDALRSMMREEGLRSYYRGLSASLWAFVPNWAIYWYTYESFKRAYTPKGRAPTPVTHVLSAVSAGGITALTTAPFWTLKSRLQVDMTVAAAQRRYRSVPHGFRTIVREEGIAGLYKGLTPTLLGLGHVAIQFPLYEYLKSRFSSSSSRTNTSTNTTNTNQPHTQQQQSHQKHDKLVAKHVLLASSLSKVAASAVFYPHEVVRTRIQVDDRVIRNSSELSRVVALVRDIVARDGVRGLYRGFGANLVRTVPACMLTFTSYELAKRFAEVQAAKQQAANTAAKSQISPTLTSTSTPTPTSALPSSSSSSSSSSSEMPANPNRDASHNHR